MSSVVLSLFRRGGWLGTIVLLVIVGCVTTPETGGKKFIVTSEAEENKLGEQAYRQILSKEKLSRNRRWNAILQRVGRRIAAAARKPEYKWEFKLIESKQQNAFALPGGKVAFYTGILKTCQTEAGLAVVMGHEVAHATARHGGQRMTTALGMQLGLLGASLAIGQKNSKRNNLILAALGLGANVGVMLPFSRGNESEADRIGLIYMSRAGYDPRAASPFWERFAKQGGKTPEFLSTHPSSSRRAANLAAQLPSVLPLYERSPKYGMGEKL